VKRKVSARLSILYFAIALIAPVCAIAQSDNYRQVDLVSNVPGQALNIDRDLVNPWGIASAPGQAFRIVENTNGSFTRYDATGAQQLFGARIATPAGATSIPHPTGVAANSTGLFVPPGSLASPFLFSTQEGTISGEYADANRNVLLTSILVVDNSSRGAVYTGLAVLTPDCCAPFLAVADFMAGLSIHSRAALTRWAFRKHSPILTFRQDTHPTFSASLKTRFSSSMRYRTRPDTTL
jgi:hypothetical protein